MFFLFKQTLNFDSNFDSDLIQMLLTLKNVFFFVLSLSFLSMYIFKIQLKFGRKKEHYTDYKN